MYICIYVAVLWGYDFGKIDPSLVLLIDDNLIETSMQLYVAESRRAQDLPLRCTLQ